MADQKVSDLPSLNGVDVDPADLLYIVDSSAGTAGSKKITIGQFQLAPTSAATANAVAYYNASKVLTSGSALTFDGTNFGIGTSSPGEKLAIIQGNIYALRTGGAKLRLADQNNEVSVESLPVGGGSEMVFKVNTSDVGRWNGTGLGIGNIAPAEQVTAGTINDRVGLYQSGTTTQLRLGSSVAGTAMMVLQYNRSTGAYQFSEGTNGNTGSPDVAVDASGNVGVGTSSPSEKLDVTGAVRSTTASGVAAQLKVRQAGWGEYFMQVPASENALAFVDNGTGTPAERARFDSSGNFGIGSSPLGTARLTVYGPQGNVQIRADDGNVTTYAAYSSGTGANAVNFYGTATNHDQAFITNNVEVVRMKKTGQMRFVPLAAAPTPAAAGDVYYDSGTNKLRCYNGSTWNDLF